MKDNQTLPVVNDSQTFLSIKLFTEESLDADSGKHVKKFLTSKLVWEGIRGFSIKVVKFKILLAYVNFTRAEVLLQILFALSLFSILLIFFIFVRMHWPCTRSLKVASFKTLK